MRNHTSNYNNLLDDIGEAIRSARQAALRAVNIGLLKANWEVGRRIIEFEQNGQERAAYGSDLLARLSRDLKQRYGRGFSRRNILDMRRFYLIYPKWQAVPAKLNWTHLVVLMGITTDAVRRFYEKQAILENWSTRELERQIDSSLYERLALSRDRSGVLKLSKKGSATVNPDEVIKDPYILDFLEIPHHQRITEKHLEQKIIDNLQKFLLELGQGFTFVARQFEISLRNRHFYVDLVFYHRILKCFVLIDLKTKSVKHQDIGQMNLYLNYFKSEENAGDDHDPIGIILSAEKDEVLVEYATGGISNKIFVSRYQLHLPDKTLLESKVRALINSKD